MLPQPENRKLYKLRRHSQDPLPNVDQLTQTRDSYFRNTQEGSLRSSFLQPKGRYYSCEASALSVKKEELRVKQPKRVRKPSKHIRFLIKQKTDCFNQQYIKKSKLQKKWIDWVRFNIKYGIYIIWNRLSKRLQMIAGNAKNTIPISGLATNVDRLGERIQRLFGIQQPHNPHCENRFHKVIAAVSNHKSLHNQNQIENKQKIIIDGRSNPQFRMITKLRQKNKIQVKTAEVANCDDTKHEPTEMVACKDELKQLASAIYRLTSHLASEPTSKIQQNSSTSNESLQQLLQEGHQRCSLIGRLLEKLEFVQGHRTQIQQNIHSVSQDPFQKEILLKILEEYSDQKIVQKINCAVQQLSKSTLAKQSKKHCSMLSKKTNLNAEEGPLNNDGRLAREQENKHRASIQLRIEGDGNVCVVPSISIRQSRLGVAKATKGVHLKDKGKIMPTPQSYQKGYFKSTLAGRQQNGRKKKTIVFSQDVEQLQQSKTQASRKISKKNSSLKSRRLINNGNNGCEPQSLRSSDYRNALSFKSVRTITETLSSSERIVKSLKTARQLKMMRGRLKKVRVVRNFRERLFHPETGTETLHQSQSSDIINATDINFTTTLTPASENTKFPGLGGQAKLLMEVAEKATVTLGTDSKVSQVWHRKLAQNAQFKILKNVKHSLKATTKKRPEVKVNHRERQEKLDLEKRKDQIQKHLKDLTEKGVINRTQLNKCRQIMSVGMNRAQLLNSQATQQEEEEKQRTGPTDSPYIYLSALKKEISRNTQLSQINKYYYNFNQFQQEEQEIVKTKQTNRKDEEFFKIRMQAQLRKEIPHFRPRLHHQTQSSTNPLQQKAI